MADVKSGSRRERSEATRRRILRAALEEFCESGFHGATIAAIARRADVAPQTVYFVFHTKAELIDAVIADAVMGHDGPVLPEESDWWAAMEAEPKADEALRIFVRGAAPLFARAARISQILWAAALTDDEVRETHEAQEARRHAAFRTVLETLQAKGPLREGLDLDAATDIFFVVCGDGTYDLLTTERGWSQEMVVEWLCDALPVLLLESRPA